MGGFREQVQRIVGADMSLENKTKGLLSLGLTRIDVDNLLYREMGVKKVERDTKRSMIITNRIAKKSKTPNRSQMKCLAIRQPWATLIAAGIKDVECRERLVPPCKRFLIAASKKRDAKRLEDVLDNELLNEVNRYIAQGILPPYDQWPTGAIIGYVDISRVTYDEVDFPWCCGLYGIKYVLKNAHMFTTPIYGKNKATPFFYNVDVGRRNPPAHIVDLNQ